jgi:hypothetical protein
MFGEVLRPALVEEVSALASALMLGLGWALASALMPIWLARVLILILLASVLTLTSQQPGVLRWLMD